VQTQVAAGDDLGCTAAASTSILLCHIALQEAALEKPRGLHSQLHLHTIEDVPMSARDLLRRNEGMEGLGASAAMAGNVRVMSSVGKTGLVGGAQPRTGGGLLAPRNAKK
jgi:hypothetical protein